MAKKKVPAARGLQAALRQATVGGGTLAGTDSKLTPEIAVFEVNHMREIASILAGAKSALNPRYWVLRSINSLLGRYGGILSRKNAGLLVSRMHKAQLVSKWLQEDPDLYKLIFATAPNNPAIKWATDEGVEGLYGVYVEFREAGTRMVQGTVVNIEVDTAVSLQELKARIWEALAAGKYGNTTFIGESRKPADELTIKSIQFMFQSYSQQLGDLP
jgi:hypothetical protein